MVPGGQAAGGYLASSRSPRARISGARCPRRAAGSSSPRAAARPRAELRSAPPAAAAVPGERRVPEPRLPQAAESCDGANAATAADGGTGTPRAGDGWADGSAPTTAAGAAAPRRLGSAPPLLSFPLPEAPLPGAAPAGNGAADLGAAVDGCPARRRTDPGPRGAVGKGAPRREGARSHRESRLVGALSPP